MISRLASFLGWLLIAVAALYAVRMHGFDRRLHAHRAAGAPPKAFALVPLRWRAELYTTEARPLLDAAWRAYASFVGWGLLGMLLILLSH
jgi:hypothetical protein